MSLFRVEHSVSRWLSPWFLTPFAEQHLWAAVTKCNEWMGWGCESHGLSRAHSLQHVYTLVQTDDFLLSSCFLYQQIVLSCVFFLLTLF